MIEVLTYSQQDTFELGQKIGSILSSGNIVCINGDLGVGKTVLVNGIAYALNILKNVSSPTFTIVNEYPEAKIPLFHFDVYRISTSDEMYDIGFEDYLCSNGIIIIEWADLIKNIIPINHIRIDIVKNNFDDFNERLIKIQTFEENTKKTLLNLLGEHK